MALVSTIYPPEVWAIESLMVLRDNLLMAGLVHRDFEKEVASAGDTVRTRKPQKLTVQDFAQQSGTTAAAAIGTSLVVENLNAREVTVVLDKHKYTAFLVEDRDAATSIKDLREEFIVPAIDPISQQVDDDVMTEICTGADYTGTDTITLVADGTVGIADALDENDVIAGRKQLQDTQCPPSGRNLVLCTEHESDLLKRSLFHQANTAGTTAALREASLGRIFGFETFSSQNVPAVADTDASPQSLAFHKNAMALVTRPLMSIPNGLGAVSAVRVLDNIGIRITTSYEHSAKGVVISFDILYGVQFLDANLACSLNP
ncbi:MAG: hypothetical protein JSW58_08160 [Candidatus Latescibacterota bacterium]|nr:MAG: hypothetical protein JSW58_08160 [Candidatus Latescibacterota bacterium]